MRPLIWLVRNRAVSDAIAVATGRARRDDPGLPHTGGPAGNASLTAWLGLALLVGSVAELVTLLDVIGLITWHIIIGVLLVPPAIAKTATTGWRILRYYAGHRAYRQAGPPPLLLRLLGPVVVLTTLAVLGSGTLLIAFGPSTTFQPLITVAGQQISWLTVHQVTFIAWGAATGLHVLARTVPAVKIAMQSQSYSDRVAGTLARGVALLTTVAVAALAVVIVLRFSGPWTGGDLHGLHHRPGVVSGP